MHTLTRSRSSRRTWIAPRIGLLPIPIVLSSQSRHMSHLLSSHKCPTYRIPLPYRLKRSPKTVHDTLPGTRKKNLDITVSFGFFENRNVSACRSTLGPLATLGGPLPYLLRVSAGLPVDAARRRGLVSGGGGHTSHYY